MLGPILFFCAAGGPAAAEIIDRVAIQVGDRIVTESEIRRQNRIAAFIDEKPVDESLEALRQTANRLVDQVLIRREMQVNRYPVPESWMATLVLRDFVRYRYGDDDKFRAALQGYQITEDELKQHLLLQLTTLRFIDFRFRPTVQVSATDVEALYQSRFGHDNGNGPPIEKVRNELERVLVAERVNQALDRWLREARERTRIIFAEGVPH